MSKYSKEVKSSPVSYITLDGEIKKNTLVGIKGVHIPNSFNIPTVRGIVGTFNAILSRFMYYGVYDKYGKERPYPMSQDHIYLPAHQLSTMIKRGQTQCYNIKNDLERIFDLDITRSSANRFRLSERLNEFLFIFTIPKLNAFMDKYDITDSEDRYRLLQLYHYRAVRPSDKNMAGYWKDYESFMKDRKHSDYNHVCQTNNQKYQTRIQKIELHIDLLSDKQRRQLQWIKDSIVEGATRLVHRFHRKLIELQQFITLMILKDKVTASNTDEESETTNSQVIDRNKTEGEMQKTHEVAAVHKKIPNVHKNDLKVTLQDIVQIGTYWNIMARGRNIEFMFSLTDKKIQSIITLVKSHGKDKVLNTIKATGYMLLPNIMKFDSFKENNVDPDSRFNKISRKENFDTRMDESEQMQNRNRQHKFYLGNGPITYDNIPTFNSKSDAKSWFKSNLNNM